MVIRVLVLILLVLSFAQAAVAETFVDGGSQHNMAKPGLGSLVKPGLVGGKLHAVHVCGRGNAVMTGAHVGQNLFLCTDQLSMMSANGNTVTWSPVYSSSDITSNYVNGLSSYQSHGMAACPPGHAMVGLHAGANILACVDVARSAPQGARLQQWVDGNTQTRQGMVNIHSCGAEGSFMVGIHVGRNLFLCGRFQ